MSSPEAPQRPLTIARAMNEAIAQEMARDARVLIMGEDIAKLGGVWGATQGLLDRFGPDRVRDTPISETAFIGAAVGLAARGWRPIVELMFVDFFGVCMDALYNLAAKQRYFSGGQVGCPMVLMTSVGGGYSDGGQHSQSLYATFAHLPGMKVVIPSNARDAKGMLVAAIRDPDPVVFMFHKACQGMGWLGVAPGSIVHTPEEPYETSLDAAHVVREGRDVTIVGFGIGVHHAIEAADALAADKISAEIVDLRSLAPIDRTTIIASVRKTGRLVVVDDDYRNCGMAAEVIASIVEAGVSLRAAPVRVTHPDIPIPFSPALERPLLPDAQKVLAACRRTMETLAA